MICLGRFPLRPSSTGRVKRHTACGNFVKLRKHRAAGNLSDKAHYHGVLCTRSVLRQCVGYHDVAALFARAMHAEIHTEEFERETRRPRPRPTSSPASAAASIEPAWVHLAEFADPAARANI